MSEQATLESISTQNEEEKNVEETNVKSFFWKNIPADWELVEGTEVFEVNPSYDVEGEITYIGMDNLTTELPYPSIEGMRDAEEYSGKLFAEDDVIFPRITPCTENGKRAIIKDIDTVYGIGSTEFIVLSPNQKKILPWYLFYLVNTHVVRDYAISRMRGSTGRQRVPYSVFRRELDVALPPLPEQRKIATVLYNVDQAIQKTEEIIEQTKRVKKGLMQDLFTEGYYEHDEFKETRLGPRKLEIPNDWTVKKIDEFAKVKGGKRLPKSHVYAKEKTKYPYLRVKDFKGGGIEQSELKYLKPKTFEKIKRYTISCNDVYISIAGTLGIAGTIPEDLDGANLTENAAKITNIKEVDHNYLALYLQSNFGQKEVHRFTVGSSQPKLSLFRIRKMEVLIPPREEQEKIVKIIKSAQKKLQKFKNEKQQLRRLKKGLMQDLLTGDVRTHDKDIEILDEVMEVEQSGS